MKITKTISSVTAATVCSVAAIVGMINPVDEGLKISQAGLHFIASTEGCRTDAYKCSANTTTIGIGHTKGVQAGQKATNEEISEWLIADVRDAEKTVDKHTSVAQGAVYDMAVSFVFNLGSGNFSKSTFLKLLQAGDYRAACNEFPRWVYSDGKDCRAATSDCAGLVVRREQEKNICLHGYQL